MTSTKGFTYFCTDKCGNLYTRYSANHNKAQYTFAALHRREGTTDPVSKAAINYSRQLSGAQGVANRFQGMTNNRSWDSAARQYVDDPHRIVSEVMPVRAYPGRHKTEPAPSNERTAAAMNESGVFAPFTVTGEDR